MIKKILSGASLIAVAIIVSAAPRFRSRPPAPPSVPSASVTEELKTGITTRIDERFQLFWKEESLSPVEAADSLTVARRLTLALHGRIPSLEEIQRIRHASDPSDFVLHEFLDGLLTDRRFADYFAERLARAYVPFLPAENFVVYRRRRFVSWLADQLHARRPYDSLVRDMIQADGLWTDYPATNFVSSHDHDPIKLASRTTRAFLGLRIDCAQCHDHPFADWKQTDYQGLAAFYGQTKLGFLGIYDDKSSQFEVEPMMGSADKKTVVPKVPFNSELDADGDDLRNRLAKWITHHDNKFFSRAAVNRVWTLLLGQGLIEPVDDLEKPEFVTGVLDLLADDFRNHDYDLDRLIRIIANSRVFRLKSAFETDVPIDAEKAFASFPIRRLRPEQLFGSIVQTSRLRGPSLRKHWLVRLIDFGNTNDFISVFGDKEEEELEPSSGSANQQLVLMNSRQIRERTEAELFTAAGRISQLAPSDAEAIQDAFLVCLARLPSEGEQQYFLKLLEGKKDNDRKEVFEDMFWALFNSTEFCWNR